MARNEEDPFIGERFGSEGQLEVIGWFGELAGSNKKYTILCHICSKDPELYGDGRFLSAKSHLQTGRVPCGCSKKYVKTKDQFEVLIRRAIAEDGFEFLGWEGDFRGSDSEINLVCPLHGKLEPKSLYSFLKGTRCRECRVEAIRKKRLIPDELAIKKFFEVGNFHPETKFIRSDRLSPHSKYRLGIKRYWFVTCGECGETTETMYSTIMMGGKSCSCSKHSQKLAYLHKISDGETPVAVKFGIANNPNRRLREQNNSSVFNVELLGVWEFETTQDCKAAEKELLSNLLCGILSFCDFRDGYTETTYLHNIDKVIQTYEQYGGRRLAEWRVKP